MNRFTGSVEGSRFRIVFNDGRMNLLSSKALADLAELVAAVPDSVRLLTFESGLPALFAAGADMREMAEFDAGDARHFAKTGQELFDRIERLRCITLALIDGDCFGGALDLCMVFDLRWATDRSRFSHPGAKIGMVTGFGGTSRWRGQISRATASKLFLANEQFSASDARKAGMIERVIDADGFAELPELPGDLTTLLRLKQLSRFDKRVSSAELHLIAERLAELDSAAGREG